MIKTSIQPKPVDIKTKKIETIKANKAPINVIKKIKNPNKNSANPVK